MLYSLAYSLPFSLQSVLGKGRGLISSLALLVIRSSSVFLSGFGPSLVWYVFYMPSFPHSSPRTGLQSPISLSLSYRLQFLFQFEFFLCCHWGSLSQPVGLAVASSEVILLSSKGSLSGAGALRPGNQRAAT